MYTVTEVAFDSLPAALQALFTVDSKIFTPCTATDDTSEPKKNTQLPDTRAQSAPALHCSDIIAQCDDIEAHELELIEINTETFALDQGEW